MSSERLLFDLLLIVEMDIASLQSWVKNIDRENVRLFFRSK
jgi:hypothetical protein